MSIDGTREQMRDEILTILRTHMIECTGPGEVTCRCHDPAGWMSWHEHRHYVADALMAVIP